MKVLIKGAHLVDPGQKIDGVRDVLISGGHIETVAENITDSNAKVIDASGLYMFPGLIDAHVHLREPGYEYKETIQTGTRAAAAGGFTAVAAMPNTKPVNDNAEVTRSILSKAMDEGVCRVYAVGAITKGQKGEDLSEMGELYSAGCVAVSDDGRPVESPMMMRRAMEYAKGFDLTVISHCEDLSLAGDGVMNEGTVSTLLGLQGIPSASEEVMVSRDIILARLTGARVHLAHLSSAGSIELLRCAKSHGIKITGETAPHYFTLTDELVKSFDAVYKMNPPLRSETDRLAIIEGLKDGTIDIIATDHAPHARDEKEREFDAALNGVVGLETSLGLSLKLHFEHGMPLMDVISKLSTAPARALNIPGGTLRHGSYADLCLVDLSQEWLVDPKELHSKSRNCPFAGMKLKGRVVRTIVSGRTVYLNGRIVAENIHTAEMV